LDFLGSSPFRYESPQLWGLDFLGFPWILSSESRLIKGLRRIFHGNIFLSLFPYHEERDGGEAVVNAMRQAGLFIAQAYASF
jgi:hypothetical protein